MVRIRCQKHESMEPICLGSTVQTSGGGVLCGECFVGMHWTPKYQLSLNPDQTLTAYLWNVVQWESCIMNLQQLYDAIMST